MSILQTLQRIRQIGHATQQPLPHREECETLAAVAYTACCEWFGTPPDAKRPYGLYVSPDETSSACSSGLTEYMIFLASALHTPEERCCTVGHEMYHRVTSRRGGLRREVWLDEMLAYLSGQWFLKRCGYTEYANRLTDGYVRRSEAIDFNALRAVRRYRGDYITHSRSNVYPPHFNVNMACLGEALSLFADKQQFAQLAWSKSLSDWIDCLPENKRAAVSNLLALTPGDSPLTDDVQIRRLFGTALRMVGRLDESLSELETVLQLTPDDAVSHFQSAFTLKRLGRLEEACAAWERATELDPQAFWSPYNVAGLYHEKNDYPHAIVWYRKALQRKPDWPQALYYLGAVLAYNGQREEARQCWERIVQLDDGWYSVSARGSLEAWQDAATHVNTDT